VLYDDADGLVTATKGEKDLIRAWLARPRRGRWFAAISESGQKHVLPWAQWNHAGVQRVCIRFEDRDVFCELEQLNTLVENMCAFLTAGATKEAIETGQYSPNQWRALEAEIERFEGRWACERGGDMFALALFLAQRDEAEVAARIEREKAERAAKKERSQRGAEANRRQERRRDQGVAGEADHRVESGVSRDESKRDHALGSSEDTATSGSANVLVTGRVGHADKKKAATRRAEQGQLSLFDSTDR
jgi:hypothetical protein